MEKIEKKYGKTYLLPAHNYDCVSFGFLMKIEMCIRNRNNVTIVTLFSGLIDLFCGFVAVKICGDIYITNALAFVFNPDKLIRL